MSKRGTCETCRNRSHGQNTRTGDEFAICARYPPVEVVIAGDSFVRFPRISDLGNWCSEYEPANPETVTEAAKTLARFVLLGDMTAARALADKVREE